METLWNELIPVSRVGNHFKGLEPSCKTISGQKVGGYKAQPSLYCQNPQFR